MPDTDIVAVLAVGDRIVARRTSVVIVEVVSNITEQANCTVVCILGTVHTVRNADIAKRAGLDSAYIVLDVASKASWNGDVSET